MLFILLTSNIIIQGITTMYKRIICFFLVVVLTISMFSFAASAEDHQHTFGEVENTIDLSGATMPNGDSLPLGLSITKSPCSTPGVDCDQIRYSWDFFGRKGSFVDDKNLPVTQVILHWYKWNEEFYGKNVGFDKLDSTNGGSNIPAAGGRNPKGYGDEGKANVNSNGKEILWVEPFGITGSYNGFSKFAPNGLIAGSSGSGTSFLPDSSSNGDYASPTYYFVAPVSGLYYVGSSGNSYDFGSFNSFQSDKWTRTDYTVNYKDSYQYSISLNKGEACYFFVSWKVDNCFFKPYKFFLNNAPIFVEPLGDSGVKNYSKITINNNTWNGNIYVDNSNNLTYIYPQYTTVNEKNETVTNISNTPIIYNNETYQYYTYDQTTKNYYYITYPNQPTPPPTATPSPTPDPDTEHPVRDMYYRWILTERRGTDDGGYNAIQVSELEFYDKDKNLISWPSDVSIKSSLDTSWNEPITNLVDNKINNKWGCNKWGSGKTGNCVIDIYAPNMQIPSYYGYVTGSDMPARDPVSWKLYYSFDGLKYYEASSMEQATDIPTDRNAKTEKWPFNYQSPTPSPSPTPAPTEKPGGSISTPETGKPGGSSGSSWWDKLLSKIGDAIIDGLLGAVSAVLKLIFKLLSTILSWIIWAVSRVFDLLPFLPPGLGGLLVGGVVVCFVIGVIKFIRG